jgi:aspergillopepsin I
LSKPLFGIALRRRAPGTFDFGFIDREKIVGDIHWVPVRRARARWGFISAGITVDSEFKPRNLEVEINSAYMYWELPFDFVRFYYSKVQGASYNDTPHNVGYGWTFPCTARLPDIKVHISGKNITVPGVNINHGEDKDGRCFGALRPVEAQIVKFGVAFLNHLYVIHEWGLGLDETPRLGFAHSQRPNVS